MSASTFAVGLFPGYASIGIVAPVLVVALRILQGPVAGGEPAARATFRRVRCPGTRRARTVSFLALFELFPPATRSPRCLFSPSTLDPQRRGDVRVLAHPASRRGPAGLVDRTWRLRLNDTAEFRALQSTGEVEPDAHR